MNRKVILLISALIAAILFFTVSYFYQRYSIIMLDPMRAVPADAAFILEAKKPADAFKKFFVFQDKNLSHDEWTTDVKSTFNRLDSLFKDDNDLREIWEERPMVITAHLVNAKTFDFLFLTNLPRGWTESKLKKHISESTGVSDEFNKREFENVNIYEMRLTDSDFFAFASYKSIAVFSMTPMLVEQAIGQMKQESSITKTKGFGKVSISSNKNIHLYFNYPLVRDFMMSLTSESSNLFFNLGTFFARWSGLEIQDNSDYLVLKGTTSTMDTLDFISVFKNESVSGSQSLLASSLAPERTALLFEFGFHDFKSFYSKIHQNSAWFGSQWREGKNTFANLEKKFKIKMDSSFISWTGNHAALLITEPAGSFLDNNAYAIIHSKNIKEATIQLERVRDAVKRKIPNRRDLDQVFLSHKISSIPLEGIIPLVYGKPFSRITNCYYTTINDYVVFANGMSALKALIVEIDNGRVLSNDSGYAGIARVFNENAVSVQIYFNPQRCVNLYVPDKLTSFLIPLYKSTGVLAQWKHKGSSVQTNVILDFRKKSIKAPALSWTTQLDTVISCAPVMLYDKDLRPCFFVQDEKNNLYKLDESGNIVWKKDLQEKILSPLHIIDLYHDGRDELLFNTGQKLYLINVDGNNIGNYPIKLPAGASNGCSVFSTTQGNKYTILIACTNHIVYAYDGTGKPASDWKYIHTEKSVSKTIQSSFAKNNTGYLIISESSGSVGIYDWKGNAIASLKDKFIEGKNSMAKLLLADSSDNASWITTDTSGSIIQFSSDGKIAVKKFDKYSSQHSFLLNQADNEITFVDTSQVTSYDLNGEKKWTLRINSLIPVSIQPLHYPDGSNPTMLSSNKDLFYMITQAGKIENGFPLNGSLFPTLIKQPRQLLLSGNAGGMISAFLIE